MNASVMALEISDFPPPETVAGLWQDVESGTVPTRLPGRSAGPWMAPSKWDTVRAEAIDPVKPAMRMMLAMMFVQMLLGIVTVLYSAPWQIAIVHQFGAVVLWVLVLRQIHRRMRAD